MTNDNLVNVRERERKSLLDMIRYLARQGIALQRNGKNHNFRQLMMLLGTEDESITAHLDGTIAYKYTHHDIQNVLLFKLETIHKLLFFFQ